MELDKMLCGVLGAKKLIGVAQHQCWWVGVGQHLLGADQLRDGHSSSCHRGAIVQSSWQGECAGIW